MFIEFLNTHLIAAKDPYGPVTVVFTMIFTAVLTYVISTAAMSGMATYSMLHALRPRGATPVSPPHHARPQWRTMGWLLRLVTGAPLVVGGPRQFYFILNQRGGALT